MGSEQPQLFAARFSFGSDSGMPNESPPTSAFQTYLAMRDVWKAFHGIQALKAVSFECQGGEIHALLGANGAGKSTLMNILVGALRPDRGRIWIRGKEMHFNQPLDALRQGIGIIRQEIDLVPWMSLADNIFLGREPLAARGLIDQRRLLSGAEEILSALDVKIDPRELVVNLSAAQQQLVMIAKVLSLRADLIVMDEPSSGLAEHELDRLFGIARSLRQQGKTIVYISHRLEEVFRICDRATVLRDGECEGTVEVSQVSPADLIHMMVGREAEQTEPTTKAQKKGKVVLESRSLTTEHLINNISLSLHEGEVVGLAGLSGAGKTTIARTLFGAERFDTGEILVHGKPVDLRSPAAAIASGIILVPEDRRRHGLFMQMPVAKNIAITHLDEIVQLGFVSNHAEAAVAQKAVEEFGIKVSGIDQTVGYLSGGNQQKVVLAKWLSRKPSVVILDEPTRGIDIRAKGEVYGLINALASGGVGILLASSELPELLRLCDRIMVLFEGRVAGTLSRNDATQEKILALSSGMPMGAVGDVT